MLHVPQIEFLVFLKLCMSTTLPTLRNDITVFTQNRNLGVVFDSSPLLRMEQECTPHPKSIITVSLTMAVVLSLLFVPFTMSILQTETRVLC